MAWSWSAPFRSSIVAIRALDLRLTCAVLLPLLAPGLADGAVDFVGHSDCYGRFIPQAKAPLHGLVVLGFHGFTVPSASGSRVAVMCIR